MNCWIQVKRSEQINRIKIALRKLEKGRGFTDRGDGVITCERENRLFCLFVFRQVCQLFLHIIFIAIGTAFWRESWANFFDRTFRGIYYRWDNLDV